MFTLYSPASAQQLPSSAITGPHCARQQVGSHNHSHNNGNAAQQQVLGKLAEHIPGMSASDLRSLDASDFTPEKVAGRISDAVASGLASARARGVPEERIQQMYDSAVQGAEKGFAEAREILTNLDMLHGSIAEQVDETEKLTFEALAGIAPNADTRSTSTSSSVIAAAERYQLAQDFSLQVRTQDGDEVRISFSNNFHYEASVAVATASSTSTPSTGSGSGGTSTPTTTRATYATYDVSMSQSTNYRFSVEGSLDDEELEALRALIDDVNQLANDFFGGDFQAALDQAQNLSFDSGQLAGMKLDMSSSSQYAAAARYQETQQFDGATGESASSGQLLGQWMNGMQECCNTSGLGFLQDGLAAGMDLMQSLVTQDTRYQEAEEPVRDKYQHNLQMLRSSMEQWQQMSVRVSSAETSGAVES